MHYGIAVNPHLIGIPAPGFGKTDYITQNPTIMKADMILKADVLDILFENRNKLYGAYVIRKQYGRRLLTAVTAALFSAALLFFIISNLPRNEHAAALTGHDGGDVVLRTPTPQTPKPPVKQPVQAAVHKKLFTPKPIPGGELGRTVVTGNQPTFTGENNGGTTLPPGGPSDDGGGGTVTPPDTPAIPEPVQPEPPVIIDNGPLVTAQVMPAYPGGRSAMMAWLQEHLQDYVTDEGEAKKALVRFVVEADGSLSGLEVAEPGDADFDKRVVKVFSKMPKWSPGRQNGHAVRVYYQIPVQLVPAAE